MTFLSNHLYFNFLSFGTLLAFTFTIFLGIFLLTLPNKSRSTFHLGIGFVCLSLFLSGYLAAAAIYSPIAAYHRYFTTFFVLPGIIHIGMYMMKFPEDNHPKASRIISVTGWIIAIFAEIYFIIKTFSVEKKFHFTGHYWDFDAEPVSKTFGIVIVLYTVVGFIIIPVFKMITVKGKDRWVFLQMSLAMLVASVVPLVTNVISRDGGMERETYLLSLVLMFVLGFFIIVLVFIGSTKDKTTFMVKIVGITLVTFLLMMQGVSFFTMRDRENTYDEFRIEYMERAMEGGERNKDIVYILQLKYEDKEFIKKDYSDSLNLDLALVKEDFLNTIIYEDIKSLPADKFRISLKKTLEKTHPYFDGYRDSIKEYIEKNGDKSDEKLRSDIFQFFSTLNRSSFVHTNKISVMEEKNFCKEVTTYLEKNKDLLHFKNSIFGHFKDCKWDGENLAFSELKKDMLKYFRYFKPSETRHYRKSLDNFEQQKHFVAYMKFNKENETITEVGYSYEKYRAYMHPAAKTQKIILLVVLFIILGFFPLFFRGSLLNPLNNLLRGVGKVNLGDLTVQVPVKVQDEIGFLSGSFNAMVNSIRDARRELQDYAENLEEKVKERTKEVQEKMEEVQALKVQQDGDYFLTSLLTKPLFYNANKSKEVSTEFIIKQKKTFEFRNKHADLGGDLCVTGNLKLGKPENFSRFTMAMNGDAMGKSMQGAGGSLVMGVVMNSIMARSAGNKRILDTSPEQWLTDIYHEIHGVFKSFNGTMVISCIVSLINDETGEMWYFNAEHPFSVLYRDGKASFIESGLNLRKLGLDSEIDFKVFKFKLLPGDVVILASDGRDDIDLTPNEPVRTINDDETLFLKRVEEGKGVISEIEKRLKMMGTITDDLSLLRVTYKPDIEETTVTEDSGIISRSDKDELAPENLEIIDLDADEDVESYYQEGKKYLKDGETEKALKVLSDGYHRNQSNPRLNKLLGLLTFKGKDYTTAVEVLGRYLEYDADLTDFWYYLSIAQKKLGHYESSLEAAIKLKTIQPDNIQNLVNLSDLNRLIGNKMEAKAYSEEALKLDPNNKNARRLSQILEKA